MIPQRPLTLGLAVCLLLCVSSIKCSAQLNVIGRRLTEAKKCSDATFTPIKPSVLGSTLRDLVWEGLDDQHVFALTKPTSILSKDGVWRSTDGGSNFEDISSHFTVLEDTEAAPYKIIAQKSKPSNMLFISTGAYIWTTTDYGTTLEAKATPGGWVAAYATFRVHPYHDDWILAMARRPDCLHGVRACPMDLMLTQNAFSGLTWTNLTAASHGSIAGFVDFDWGANLCPNNDCDPSIKLDEKRVFATMYRHPGDLDQDWDPDVIFTWSDDFFHSSHLNVQCGNQFEILGRSIYLAMANSCPTGIDGKPHKDATGFPEGISLYTSTDGGHSFTQACVPAAVKQSSYELTETHDRRGAVAIVDYIINTSKYPLHTSSIYLAGPHHAIFSLSLTNVFKDPFGYTADFSKIEGIPGAFIANQIVSRYGDELDIDNPMDNFFVTKVTYNGGGGWRLIPAPTTFRNKQCNMCGSTGNCYLHLFGLSTWIMGQAARPAVYSHPSAPGIVLGVGNVAPDGSGLGDNDGMCTWISRDGGVSWSDVAPGAYIYEFADWGGIVVMTPHEYSGVADKVIFSLDYGECWYTVPLETALYVSNIRVEPDGQRPRVLVHGSACTKDQNPKCMYEAETMPVKVEGIVYAVDVATLLGAQLQMCKPIVDFEEWTLPDAMHHPACVLGAHRYYTRRKGASTCLQGADYVRPASRNETCACDYNDAECDYGFVRLASDNNRCHPLPKGKVQQCPAIEADKYVVSDTGLRLVHNDVCTGVEKIIPDTDGRGQAKAGHKPHHHHGGGGGPTSSGAASGFFIFVVVVAALGGAFTAWWKFLAGDGVKDQILELVAPVASFAQSLWGWLVDRCTGRYSSISAADNELNYFQPLGDAAEPEGSTSRFTL